MKTNILLLATTAIAGSLFATAAAAQSTGTTDVEAVIVTGRSGPKTVDGAMIAETVTKNRNTITQEFIAAQAPAQTILQTLNLTPGLSFTNNDPFGSSGGNIRLHGQDGAHIGLLIDGVPLNDAGNYAVFPNQQLDPELIEQANVNTGSTDVDTVTASSTGGIINYTTRKTANRFGGLFDVSGGSFDYKRVFGLIDSGPIGPLGTKMYLAGSYQDYDKFKGPGDLEKKQVNLRIDQPLRAPGDFISLLANYGENRNVFYYNPNLQNLTNTLQLGTTVPDVALFGWDVDYFDTYIPATARAGVADTVAAQNSATRGFYGVRLNPSNTGTIRGLSRFTILPNLHLTVDPSFNYTLANGGGTTFFNEVAGTGNYQIQTAAGVGRDLNGDGDTLDQLLFYSPSNTNTRRFALNTSLIYDLTPTQRFRFAYAYDHAHTRQTGEYSYLAADGFPGSPFSAKDGYDATPLLDGAGQVAQKRNRDSIAELNQYSLEYRGRFFNDRLSFNAGVRIPELSRELHQFCYTVAGSSGANPICTVRTPTVATVSPNATVQAVSPNAVSQRVTFGALTTASTLYYAPFALNKTFDAVLPNVGASYKVTSNLSVYANYTESQSAPRVDNLYGLQLNGIPTNVQPETSTSEDYGFRYQARRVILQVGGYHTSVENRIVSTRDPTDDSIIDRNVGAVEISGVDAQVSLRPADPIAVYLSASYTDAETQNNLFVGGTAVYPNSGLAAGFVPLKGKQVVETPKYTFAGRVTYDLGMLKLGIQGKYTGKRFVTDVNDLSVPAFFVADFDARLELDRFRKGLSLQFNVTNLFDAKYYGTLGGTQTTVVAGAPGAGSAFASRGAPRAAVVTLKAAF